MKTIQLCKKHLNVWANKLKQQARALYFTWQDPRSPKLVKILAFITIAYLFSPIDLIPDFIPVIGLLDDLLLLPLLCWLVIKLVPEVVWQDNLKLAQTQTISVQFEWMGKVVIFIWSLLAIALLLSVIRIYY